MTRKINLMLQLMTISSAMLLATSHADAANGVLAATQQKINPFIKCIAQPTTQFNGNIVDAALATPRLSTLAGALQTAGLTQALAGPGPYTVYAPTNEAFAKVPAPILNAVLADKNLLAAVLTYHVTPGESDPRFAIQPTQVTTLQGESVFYSFDSKGPGVNQATVECKGVKANNGVIWFIDSVLLPQF